MGMYPNINLENVESVLAEIFFRKYSKNLSKTDLPIGKVLSDEGVDVYHIGNGHLTGKAGWDKYKNNLKNETK